MKTVIKEITNEIVINKSRFIAVITSIKEKEDLNSILNNLKERYKDATHYCYAYIIDNYQKASDDGEPQKTAGMPILNCLVKNNLTDVLCVVIRYFGGIKLGAGGLVRAYSNAVKEVITKNEESIKELINGFEIILEIPYDKQKDLENLLSCQYSKEYSSSVIYKIKCNKELKENLEKLYLLKQIKETKIVIA